LFFSEQYVTTKSVSVEKVIALVCRGLAVSPAALTSNKSRYENVLAVIPSVHEAMFTILKGLICCCGSLMLPFSSVIAKLLSQSVDLVRNNTKLRVHFYSCLSTWVMTAKTGCLMERYFHRLQSILIADLKSNQPQLILKGT